MKTTNANIILGNLTNVEVLPNMSIKLTLKNGSTLELMPQVEEGLVSGYEMDYLTGTENKNILKKYEKIRKLQSEIQEIKENGVEGSDSSEEVIENEITEEKVVEEENNDNKEKIE